LRPDNSKHKEQKGYDDAFRELTSQGDVLDIAKNQFYRNYEHNFQRMGIKCALQRSRGHITKGVIYGNDDMYIEVSPIVENGNARPMMRWYEYDGALRDITEREGLGIHGKYVYQARFVLKSNDWDPQKAADFDLTEEDFNGECTIATVEYEGWNFQEFFQDVLFILSEQHNVRFYPQLSRNLTGF
jgi:hypothetical protein